MLLKKLKRLKQYEKSMRIANEMLELQGRDGNYNYDSYMLGLYNGMEYIVSLLEVREPNFISGKDVEFTNNKTQQKEFIKYLEDEIERKRKNATCMFEYNDTVLPLKEVLQEYKEIIGVSDEKK